MTIVRLSTGYCCIRYLIGRFWLILDTFKNGYSSLNAAHSVNIARKCAGRISKSKLDNTECNARSSRVVALLAFKLKRIKQVNLFFAPPGISIYIYIYIYIYTRWRKKKLTCLIYFNLKTKRAIRPKLRALHSVLFNLNFDIRPVQFRAILTERAAFKLE